MQIKKWIKLFGLIREYRKIPLIKRRRQSGWGLTEKQKLYALIQSKFWKLVKKKSLWQRLNSWEWANTIRVICLLVLIFSLFLGLILI